MGTDIYLKWDKMSKKDHDGQITGWDAYSGATGYLRASIGMMQENAFLRKIFPQEVWEPNNPKCPTYSGEEEWLEEQKFDKAVERIKGNDKGIPYVP